MGQDAKAYLFYGYKHSISTWVDEDGFDLVYDSGGESYLAIDSSIQYFDWDYGVQALDKDVFDIDSHKQLNEKVRAFLTEHQYEFSSDDIGWFVICDYS